MPDYRKLLKAYMEEVILHEGTSFLDISMSLTQEELTELFKVQDEIGQEEEGE